MDLEDSFESDFNARLEDGSPYEVSTTSLDNSEHPSLTLASSTRDVRHKIQGVLPAVQVAKVLVLLHYELLQGSTETLDRLRRQAPAGVSGSMQQKVQHI